MGSVFITPAEDKVRSSYLRWIHEQEDHERLENYRDYDKYYYGDQVVKLPEKIKLTLEQELGVIGNYCRPVVDIAVQFLVGAPVSLDVTEGGVKTDLAHFGERLLYYVYRQNGLLYKNMLKLLRVLGKKGDVFLKFYVREQSLQVSVLRPSRVFPKYYDDEFDIMESCAIKHFVFDDDGNRVWRAQVFYPDRIEYYYIGTEPSRGRAKSRRWRRYFNADRWQNVLEAFSYEDEYRHRGDAWELIETIENPMGIIPIVHIKNNIDDLPFGVSDLQVVTPLQDVLNKSLTDMLVGMDTQAFQRLFIMGSMSNDDISVSPGTIVQLPEGEGVQVVPAGSIQNYVYGLREIVQQIAAVTQIPVEAFQGFAGIPVSGYALRILFMNLESKCNERMANIKSALMQLNRMIFLAASMLGWGYWEQLRRLDTDVHFTTGIPIDKLADTQYLTALMANRVMSRESVMERVGIENIPEEKRRIAEDLYELYGIQMAMAERQTEGE